MSEQLQKARAKLLPFKKKKKGPAVAIDLDKESVVLAETAPGNSGKISRLAIAKMDLASKETSPKPEELGAALKKTKIGLPKSAYMLVPRSQVVLRPLIVPNVDDVRELASIINFQIGKDLPFRLEEAVVDFKVTRILEAKTEAAPQAEDAEAESAVPQNRLEVLVGAIKNDVVQHYKALAAAGGFNLAGLGLRSSAYLQVLRVCGETLPESAVLLLVLRQDEITVDILANDSLALSRVINIALPANSADETFLNSLGLEVVRSVHSFEGMMWQKSLGKILVAGATGLERKIADVLASRLGVPADVFDPGKRLDIKDGKGGEASAAMAAIGLSLAAQEPGGLPIDFLHPKKPAVPRNTRRTTILVASAAALVLMLTLFAVRAQVMKQHNKIRTALQEQVTDADKKLPIYRRLKGQAKSVKTWLEDEQDWLDHLAYISGILPGADQLYVSSLATTSQRVIRMSVQAKTGELLAELDKKLRAAGYEVKPLSITPASDKYGYNFRTTVELNVPKKMKLDLQKVSPPKRPEDDASKSS
jgi:Tfp pilus assembly PilM family ATPase